MAITVVRALGGGHHCEPSDTNLCMKVNVFAGESGYYEFTGHSGVSPDITVKIGSTYVFDQTHHTNWYHAVGFAYYPDGAHGDTWGGDERDEVEGQGELLYKIDGAATTCPDAGDTGLDCYEPEFFYPRDVWMNKHYTAELTITQEMADKSHGGVIYYFCHIHSKMSGKLIIQNADGTVYTPTLIPQQLPLYSPVERDAWDMMCGTTGASVYSSNGPKTCGGEMFLPGTHDTIFEACMQAIDCQMNREMRVAGYDNHANEVALFMQQMIPHHLNAVNMAKILLHQAPIEVADVEDLESILYNIVNVQNYQVHQFRNYLGANSPKSKGSCYSMSTHQVTCDVAEADCGEGSYYYAPGYVSTRNGCCHCSASCGNYDESCSYYDTPAPHQPHIVGHHCDSSLPEGATDIATTPDDGSAAAVVEGCTSSETHLCMKINTFIGESGYYEFAGYTGPSPDITVKIGQTYVFDQGDPSNWYHAVGFAYYPDGAHGATWGGEERDEVEGAGELLYKIDGAATTCPDAGDTGLDCYEPEFFYPRGDWMGKHYTAELTITQEMADKSHGGVLYYFCHIHSKMSGKLIIQNADGTAYVPKHPEQLPLYQPYQPGPVDRTCGTYEVDSYAGTGSHVCDERFLCGSIDTTYEKCFQAIDCKMRADMLSQTSADHANKVAVFMQQMIAHHLNAVNMAKVLMKQVSSYREVEDLPDILWGIINVQTYQIHQFRNYLGGMKTTGQLTCGEVKEQYKANQCCGAPDKLFMGDMR